MELSNVLVLVSALLCRVVVSELVTDVLQRDVTAGPSREHPSSLHQILQRLC